MKIIIDDTQSAVTLVSHTLRTKEIEDFMNDLYYFDCCSSFQLDSSVEGEDVAVFGFDNRDLMRICIEHSLLKFVQKNYPDIFVEVEEKKLKKKSLKFPEGGRSLTVSTYTI